VVMGRMVCVVVPHKAPSKFSCDSLLYDRDVSVTYHDRITFPLRDTIVR
jgi:hypothetical protein